MLNLQNSINVQLNRWVRNLNAPFEEQGMFILDSKCLPIENDIALPWTVQHLMAATEFINNMSRQPDLAKDLWETYERAAQEVSCGATMRMAMISVCGRKASTSGNSHSGNEPITTNDGSQPISVIHSTQACTEEHDPQSSTSGHENAGATDDGSRVDTKDI